MAMKIRCHDCRRRISIDEAFAGGFCRCPYCKAITKVPARAAAAVAPAGRPQRPQAPGAPPPAEPSPAPHEAIPLANPVKVQGIVALIMLGLFALLIGGSLFVYFKVLRPSGKDAAGTAAGDSGNGGAATDQGQTSPAARKNPFALGGIRVAGMEFDPPVVYVVDGSWGMSELYDPAGAVVRHSIRSLGGANKFNVICVREGATQSLSPTWAAGGADGDAKAADFLQSQQPAGATKLTGALQQALDAAGVKTVVLLAAKGVEDPAGVVEKARSKGVAVLTVSLGGFPEATGALKALAAQTGGKCTEFRLDDLLEKLAEAPLLP